MPSSSGIERSINTMSGCSSADRATASAPSLAVPTTSMPSAVASTCSSPRRTTAWSSTMSTLIMGAVPRPVRAVPAPGAESTTNRPPASATRSVRPCRPKCPSLAPRPACSGTKPTPSSTTSSVAVRSRSDTRTVTVVACACDNTLRSASCAARYSSPETAGGKSVVRSSVSRLVVMPLPFARASRSVERGDESFVEQIRWIDLDEQ